VAAVLMIAGILKQLECFDELAVSRDEN